MWVVYAAGACWHGCGIGESTLAVVPSPQAGSRGQAGRQTGSRGQQAEDRQAGERQADRQQGTGRQGNMAPVETSHAVLGDAVAPGDGQKSLLRPGNAG